MVNAVIKETEHLATEGMLEHAVISPAGLALPGLRRFLFFKDEDPTKQNHGRFQVWCSEGLRELWYNMDKDYSRVASRMAISQLFDEINVLREPLRAKQTFRLMVIDKAIASKFLGTVVAGNEVS